MIVYIDVLITLNIFVNYFILLITSKVNHAAPGLFRHILGAFIGALFSLYLFVPKQHPAVELTAKLIFSLVIVLSTYGFPGAKKFIRLMGAFYAITFLYAGLMLGLWFTLKPGGMAINNGVVYFNISPMMLIAGTVISYLIIRLIRRFTKRPAEAGKRYRIHITLEGKTVSMISLLDTGNSLNDVFSDAPVAVVGFSAVESILPEESKPAFRQLGGEMLYGGKLPSAMEKRYRLVPYSVVGGSGVLPAFRCDKIEVELDEPEYHTKGSAAFAKPSHYKNDRFAVRDTQSKTHRNGGVISFRKKTKPIVTLSQRGSAESVVSTLPKAELSGSAKNQDSNVRTIKNAIVAVSAAKINDDYDALIGADFLV